MSRALKCECGTCETCKRRESGRRERAANREAYNAYQRRWYAANAAKHRETAKASRNRRIDAARAYDRERGHRVYDPSKEQARRKFAHAIESGRIVRQPCEVCGQANAEGHHDDYSRPLDVRWLCRTHHMVLHRSVAA